MIPTIPYVRPGDGLVYRVIGGDEVTLKATSEDTGGAYALIETVVPPQGGPPRHVHTREDESFYVLEGELEFHVGDETFLAGAGAFLHAPRDIAHDFKNTGHAPAKILVYITPGGFERFIQDVAEMPSEGPPDWPRLATLAQQYGLAFV